MKKVNNQNPLKTFNDNYAARAKKVVEGNKKLVKAQVGKQIKSDAPDKNTRFGLFYGTHLPKTQEELDSLRNTKLNKGYIIDNKKGVDYNWIAPSDTNYVDYAQNPKTGSSSFIPKKLGTKENLKINKDSVYTNPPADWRKKGGQTKSKKK